MARLAKRALVPARLRSAVRGWFDSRYISLAEHRQDIKDALWEVQVLRREVTTLRAEVERLQARTAKAPAAPAGRTVDETRARRWDDAHRLATETAAAMERVLQNEVLLWQAVDRAAGRTPETAEAARPAGEGRTPGTARTGRAAGTALDRAAGSAG
ncbi:hypothetical protein [Streptosporangium pseudovulgare]|uniref:Cell division protein DivIVA n=1 Tax=Streptosporangium pseudovulgare TaxID=35765 RepID=A0ABQ2QYR6_9ACTN|nr:hypothetical protein [Streptosporangium pseudovulgare]GGQ02447.1 hypothetical protein GCM10010140_35740 [Streptosporangium pseudovulgare]